MPKEYTVEAPDGRQITFEWNGQEDPTDADMEEIFASSGPSEDFSGVTSGKRTSQPPFLSRLGNMAEQQFGPPLNRIRQGQYQMIPNDRMPNFPAGAANIGLGTAELAMAVPGMATSIINSEPSLDPAIAGTQIALHGIDATAGKVLGGIGEFFGGHTRNATQALSAPFLGEQGAKEFAEPMGGIGNLASQVAAGEMLGSPIIKSPGAIGRGARAGADRLMGSALQAGGTLGRAKELSRFANERGITLTPEGSLKAQNIVQSLQYDINEGIINPLTANGMFVKRSAVRQSLEKMLDVMKKEEILPDQSAIRAIEKQLESLKASEATHGEYMTPRAAQDFKVKNNQILGKYYDKRNQMFGSVKQAAKSEGLASATAGLRSELESLHPELRGLNWTEGIGLELSKAIDTYLLEKYQGKSGASSRSVYHAATGHPAGILHSAYDLLGTRAFRSKLAVALDKLGRTMTGEGVGPLNRLRNPVQPNPPVAGLLPPWFGSPISEGYRSPQIPFYTPPFAGEGMTVSKAKPNPRYGIDEGAPQYLGGQ